MSNEFSYREVVEQVCKEYRSELRARAKISKEMFGDKVSHGHMRLLQNDMDRIDRKIKSLHEKLVELLMKHGVENPYPMLDEIKQDEEKDKPPR